MTPSIDAAKKSNVAFTVHEYAHDSSRESYGLEASEKLGVAAEQVFKTLVVSLDGKEMAVAVIPVSEMLSMKKIAKCFGVKKAVMADKTAVERTTGYVLGGVSPIGQKKRLKTAVDCSAEQLATVYVSAGRRGLEIELAPTALNTLVSGVFFDLIQD